MSHQLNYTVKHHLAGSQLCIELHSKFAEFSQVLSRTVVDTQDKIIRENLIKLGWTPPGEKTADTRATANELLVENYDLRKQVANLTYSNDSHRKTAEEWRGAATENQRLKRELCFLRSLVGSDDAHTRWKNELREAFEKKNENSSK